MYETVNNLTRVNLSSVQYLNSWQTLALRLCISGLETLWGRYLWQTEHQIQQAAYCHELLHQEEQSFTMEDHSSRTCQFRRMPKVL